MYMYLFSELLSTVVNLNSPGKIQNQIVRLFRSASVIKHIEKQSENIEIAIY